MDRSDTEKPPSRGRKRTRPSSAIEKAQEKIKKRIEKDKPGPTPEHVRQGPGPDTDQGG